MAIITIIRILAALCIAFIAFMTAGPSNLRPKVTAAPRYERAVAFAGTTFLIVLSFPQYPWLAASFAVIAAGASEYLQSFFPDRHAHFHHAAAKALGSAAGALIGLVFMLLFGDFLRG
jgi:hypothetical protein